MMNLRRSIIGLALVLGFVGGSAGAEEITFPGERMAKLDTFEALNLEEADKLFGKKDYKGAYAAYKAYSFEFAKSAAMPYVLLRMGRCLHLLEKRNAAVKGYQSVVDYFPDDVRYAAAALYYIGECHGQNGDIAKKTAVWARMVKDDEYVAQPNSGTALTFLGGEMEKLGKHDEAADYQWRTAVAFLQSNPKAAETARRAVIAHYVRRSPNHEKLKEFYVAASGFDGRGQKTEKPEEDARYWSMVLATASDGRIEKEVREKACAYWTAKMGDRFVENDALRKQWIDALLVHEKSTESWLARLEKQYGAQPATLARVIQWCGYFGREDKARSAFYAKESKAFLGSLKNEEKMRLMNQLRHPLGMHEEAQSVMRSVSTNGMSDEELKTYAGFVANYEPEEVIMGYYARMKDKLFAAKCRFDYFKARTHRNRPNAEKALAEIPALKKSPDYAGVELSWAEGQLHQGIGNYEEAIKAYNAANKQPDSTWAVTECYLGMKNYPQAIKTVRELQSVKATASRAAFKIADIYRVSGDKGKEVDQLRLVLKQFPKSGESSEAHRRLESYGVALVGGESKAVE